MISINNKSSSVSKNNFLLIVLCLLTVIAGCGKGGEKYGDEAKMLAVEIDRELLGRGYCKDKRDCNERLPTYVEYGDGVYFNFYDVGKRNKKMFTAIAELVLSRGIEITNGAPITLTAFPMPHDEYVNFKNKRNPIAKVEVTQ